MIRGILLSVLLLCLPAWALAATYYIDDAGSNANAGTSTGAPWLTWNYAFANSACGDTLIVKDGTYTPAVNGNPVLTKVCTAGSVFTVQAQNQRVALIAGTGATFAFEVVSSAYIVLDGLRIKSADLNSGGNADTVHIGSSNHITMKNGIVYQNNRYKNSHLIWLDHTTSSLIEDTELYEFHRHGVLVGYSDFNVIRRLYCHGRARADISGGYGPTGFTASADSCIAIYPASDNIVENVIAENTLSIAEDNASDLNRRNKFLGNIALGTRTSGTDTLYGYLITARGNDTTHQPQDMTIRDTVCVDLGNTTDGGGECISVRSALNTQVSNTTSINAKVYGFAVSKDTGQTGGGVYSFFGTNLLAISNDTTGFFIESTTQTWTVTNANAYQNATNYKPSTFANYTPTNPASAVDPQMGSCYLWAPDGSAAQTKGWGATILYRYKNGVLTNVPLWNRTTGEFPHGAIVAGLNDVAGQSLFDVHKRLNVNTNGCSFPANYGAGVTDVDAPSTPTHLSVF